METKLLASNRDQMQVHHVAYWDEAREVWVPRTQAHVEATGAALGDGWAFDSYYGAFFPNRDEVLDALRAGAEHVVIGHYACESPARGCVVDVDGSVMMSYGPELAQVESATGAPIARDCAEARARHLARAPFIVPFNGSDDFPGSPWQSVVLVLPVGQPEAMEGTTDYALFASQNGVLTLWLREDLRQSPFICFYDAPPLSGRPAWLRPIIGGVGWRRGSGGAELRCGFDAEGALHHALPTHPDTDPFIIWWREETAEEWLGSPDEYEHAVVERRDRNAVGFYSADLGWETVKEPLTQTVYCRRRRR